ncbi:hypothetical protein SEA_FORK_4 [Microbacterium phage Fork]|nr:hypothetical protein SEA_FORK_116 [Microbacterium phage Fork]AXC36341.1 hypothetical protein SEA_FORK_4 [Microbacterium phage Fork]
MRIHSDIIVRGDLSDLLKGMPGVHFDHVSEHGSRKRRRGLEVRLIGNSPYLNMAKTDNAATWDEWGVFMARVFDLDSDALIGGETLQDFDQRTNYRFDGEGLPVDTHPRHTWGDFGQCTKCSAKYGNR